MILASILLLGNLGLAPDVFDDNNGFLSVLGSGEPGLVGVAFADDDDDDDDDDRSDDQLTYLKIKYLCLPPDETILVKDMQGNEIIPPQDLSAGFEFETFEIFDVDFPNGDFKSKIFLSNTIVPDFETTEIGTSNAQVLFIGQTFDGCYEIVDIFTEPSKAGAISAMKRCICCLTISCGLLPTLK